MRLSKFGWLAAVVAVAAVVGAVAYSPQPAEALTGTKTCNGSAAVTTTECTLNFTQQANAAATVDFTVTMVGPAQFDTANPPTISAFAGVPAACAAAPPSIENVTASSYTVSLNAACNTNTNYVITEPVAVSATGNVQETVARVPALAAEPDLLVNAPVFFVAAAAEISAAKSCAEATLPIPAGALTCTFTITNVGPAPAGTTYQVQITGPGALATATAASVSVTGSGGTGTCVTPAISNAQVLSTTAYTIGPLAAACGAGTTIIVTETILPTAGGVLSQTVARSDGATATATAAIGAGFRAGTTFVIRCPTALNPGLTTTFPLVVPGPIGGAEPIAIGVLPAVLICEALFVDADGDPESVAPGTIEISSLNGTLVDLNGGLSTNLRIGCDAAADVSTGGDDLTVDVNTCQGVRFGVLGAGVGFVELRARYEPSSAAAAAGILEREASAEVAFIAPPVVLNLLLNPNPVAVDATGTATLRFNRTVTVADTLLINPQTGAPLAISLGTPLNGTATFTSSAPNVATFTGGIAAGETVVTGTVPAGVTVAAGATVNVRCGSATPVTAASAADIAAFFGGCAQVSAEYRGVSQGSTQITGTFAADLPGAFGGVGALSGNVQALVDTFGSVAVNQRTQTLEVVGVVASTQRLVPGCNNVVAPVSETVAQVATRVDPASAAISIWKQVPGTTQFQGAAIGGNVPASVSNLTSVNALDAIFICVNAAATYRIS